MANQLAIQENTETLAKAGLDQAGLSVLLENNFNKASEDQKSMVILALCKAVQIDPVLTPFKFHNFGTQSNPQIKLYAGLDFARIIAKAHNVSVGEPHTHWDEETRIFTCRGPASSYDSNGRQRTTWASARLHIPEFKDKYVNGQWVPDPAKPIKGQELANAFMKCESKQFRRAVLSHLGMNTAIPASISDDIDELGLTADENPRGKFFDVAPKIGVPSGSDVASREERRKLYCEVLGRNVSGGPELSDGDWQLMLEWADNRYAEIVLDVSADASSSTPVTGQEETPGKNVSQETISPPVNETNTSGTADAADAAGVTSANGEEVGGPDQQEPANNNAGESAVMDPQVAAYGNLIKELTGVMADCGLVYHLDHIALCDAFTKIAGREIMEIGDLKLDEISKCIKYFEAVRSGTYELRPSLKESIEQRKQAGQSPQPVPDEEGDPFKGES